MPVLPIIRSRVSGLGAAEYPRVSADAYGAGAWQALGNLAEIGIQAQNEQDNIQVKQQAVMLDDALENLKEEVKAEPDFAKRSDLYQQKSAEYLKTQLDSISSERVKSGLQSYYSIKFPRESLKFRVENQKDWGIQRVADTEALGDMMADRIIKSDNPEDAAKYRSLYLGQLQQLSTGPYAPLTALKRQQMADAFDTKITMGRGLKDAVDNPGEMLSRGYDDPRFGSLPFDKILELQSRARTEQERVERNNDKATKDVHDKVKNYFETEANNGRLSGNDQQALLNGTASVYLTPSEGREIVKVNQEPPSGAGSTAAKVIWQEYVSKPRSIPTINKARAALNHLQSELQQPDPFIIKYLDTLQSDQNQQENQNRTIGQMTRANDIAETNRAVRDNQTTLEADKKPAPKILDKIFGNQDQQNKARVERETRLHGKEAGEKLAKELAKGRTQKQESVQQKHGAVLDYPSE